MFQRLFYGTFSFKYTFGKNISSQMKILTNRVLSTLCSIFFLSISFQISAQNTSKTTCGTKTTSKSLEYITSIKSQINKYEQEFLHLKSHSSKTTNNTINSIKPPKGTKQKVQVTTTIFLLLNPNFSISKTGIFKVLTHFHASHLHDNLSLFQLIQQQPLKGHHPQHERYDLP